MKKIIAIVIAAVVSFGVFAEGNMEKSFGVGIGTSITQSKFSVDENSGSSDVTFNSVNFSVLPVEFRGVFDNNFSVMLSFEAGILCSNSIKYDGKTIDNLKDASGTSLDLLAGFGYRFVNTEKFSFIASGILGYRGFDFSADLKGSSKESVELSLYSIAVGLDLFGEYKINSKWGIYAGVTGYANIFEDYTYSQVTDMGYCDTVTRRSGSTLFSGFTVKPRIGVSIKY